jgi:hypothetical protein
LFALADETLYWLVREAGSLNSGLLSGSTLAAVQKERRPAV